MPIAVAYIGQVSACGASVMADTIENLVTEIREIVGVDTHRDDRARRVADAIRAFGQYRWVGIYDIAGDRVSILAWSGPGAPAHPTFPPTKGLTGAAISAKAAVVVGDVTKDPRYLTAFGNTRSEIIIPILDATREGVVGTIDVESELTDAFSAVDRQTLERCAAAAIALWTCLN